MNGRILFIDEDQERNGSTVSMEYLLSGFKRAGYEVYVLTWKQSEWTKVGVRASATLIDGRWGPVTTITLCVHFMYTAPPWSVTGLWSMAKDVIKFIVGGIVVAKAIRALRPDIVYLNEYSVVQASIVARWLEVPVAVHVRSRIVEGVWGLRRRFVSRLLLRYSSAIFPITRIEAEQLQPRPTEESRIHVIGEFFPAPPEGGLPQGTCRKLFGLPPSGRVVAMLGGIKEIKGTLQFLQAALEVQASHRDVVFAVAGSDFKDATPQVRAYFDACMDIARRLQDKGACALLGEIDNPLELVAASDIIVSPSTVTHFSRPIIEGWGFGKPVVAVRTKHTEELVTDGVNGLLVPAGDVRALASCFVRLLDDEGLCRRLGLEGKKKTQSDFDAETNLGRIVEICAGLHGRRT